MEYIICIVLFLLGLLFLVKGADAFLEGALWFARRLHMSELAIGATLVSIGTTLPESIVSATAAYQGHSDMAYGNAIGSIICNTGLIVGLVLLLYPPVVKKGGFLSGVVFFFFAAFIYIASALIFKGIPRFVAALLLVVFIVYIVRNMQNGKDVGLTRQRVEGRASARVIQLALGAVALYFGSKLMVDNAQKFAIWLNVPRKVIALTVVALGTSLPELVTAIMAIYRGHGALSVGNILGANFLNLVLVSSVSSMILPTIVDATAIRTDLIVMLFMMLLFTFPIISREKGSRLQGAGLIATYLVYVFALYH